MQSCRLEINGSICICNRSTAPNWPVCQPSLLKSKENPSFYKDKTTSSRYVDNAISNDHNLVEFNGGIKWWLLNETRSTIPTRANRPASPASLEWTCLHRLARSGFWATFSSADSTPCTISERIESVSLRQNKKEQAQLERVPQLFFKCIQNI